MRTKLILTTIIIALACLSYWTVQDTVRIEREHDEWKAGIDAMRSQIKPLNLHNVDELNEQLELREKLFKKLKEQSNE